MCTVLNGRRLTEQTLLTTSCFVEQLLYDRLLTAMSFNMSHLEALTANNFSFGHSTLYLLVGLVQTNKYFHWRVFRLAQCYTDLF